jgi:hypothetical protein
MPDDKTVRGTPFACFHAGAKEGWAQFRLEPPDVPLPARGNGSCGACWVPRAWRCR